MKLVLTEADFAAMPAELRRDLLARLLPTAVAPAAELAPRDEQNRVVLDEPQAMALLRHVSFGRRHRPLYDLLRFLAKEGTLAAPVAELGLDERQLRRRAQVLDRLVQLLTRDRKARLVAPTSDGRLSPHAQTRAVLQDIFERLDRSSAEEASLWE